MYDIKMYTIYTPEQRVYNVLLCEGGKLYNSLQRMTKLIENVLFERGERWQIVFECDTRWFNGIIKILRGEGVKQSPLESYKISIIRYGWEGYGWEWIIRGGDLFSWSEINCQSYVSWIMNLTWSFMFITKIQIILRK